MVSDVNELKAEFERRSERRDSQYAELAGLLGANSSELDALSAEVGRLRETLERVRQDQPGVVKLWAPAVFTVSMVASALVFVMVQSLKPLEHDIAAVEKQTQAYQTEAGKVDTTILTRQRDNEALIHYQRGLTDGLRKQVEAIDASGSRKRENQ